MLGVRNTPMRQEIANFQGYNPEIRKFNRSMVNNIQIEAITSAQYHQTRPSSVYQEQTRI